MQNVAETPGRAQQILWAWGQGHQVSGPGGGLGLESGCADAFSQGWEWSQGMRRRKKPRGAGSRGTPNPPPCHQPRALQAL